MIKECKVLLNNSAVTVVRFGDRDVQLPPIGRKANTVFVRFENGRYEIADGSKAVESAVESNIQEEEKKPEQPKVRRRMIKKPVVEVEE